MRLIWNCSHDYIGHLHPETDQRVNGFGEYQSRRVDLPERMLHISGQSSLSVASWNATPSSTAMTSLSMALLASDSLWGAITVV